MPEATSDAAVFIAASFQALNRALQNNKETIVCDSTIVILFAAFFLEANLNHINSELGLEEEMLDYLYGKRRKGKKYPGMLAKMKWFHNNFIREINFKKGINEIKKELEAEFPGFSQVYEFRNKISHGKLDLVKANLEEAEKIRKQIKSAVNKLYDVTFSKTGIKIPRGKTYKEAISSSNF